MKKATDRKKHEVSDDNLLPEYDIRGADLVRGKYYRRYMASSNVIVLDPDVSKVFHGPKAVNKALRSIIKERKTAAG